MPKVIKSVRINVISDDASAVSGCSLQYEVAHSDDETLQKSCVIELPLNLTDAQNLVNYAVSAAEDEEGIV